MVNMRPFNPFEQRNLRFLVNLGLKFTQVEITPTGLGKSILDATAPMRSFFLEHDIHDNKEYFRYKRIGHTKNPNVGQFDMLLEQNLITVDLLLSRPSGHGDTYSFKIKKKAMSLLFPESIIHDLML